jgi:hypothetical protein
MAISGSSWPEGKRSTQVEIRKISDTITEIDGKVRIEVGHVRRRDVATKELLDDKVTAAHYQVGAPDAVGKAIKLGEPMDYIDWRSEERVYYVYRREMVVEPLKLDEPDGPAHEVERWVRKGDAPDYEQALTLALQLV